MKIEKSLIKKLVMFMIVMSFTIILMVPSSFAVVSGESASVVLTNMKNEPDPAQPGQYFETWFKIENLGNSPAKNVSIEFVPSFPFSLDTSEKPIKSIGSLGIAQDAVVSYRVKVDDNAIEGLNKLSLRYKVSDDFGISFVETFDIQVLTKKAKIDVESVSVDDLSPGSVGSIKIILKNNGVSIIDDIVVALDISTTATPFAPVDSISEVRLGKLTAGKSSEAVFNIIAIPGASAGVYKVPVTITYTDLVGNDFSKSSVIGIVIGGKPNIYVGLEYTEILTSGDTGLLYVSIINKGIIDIKLLDISLGESDDYTVLSSKNVYVGDLESDDYDTAEFNIHVFSNGIDGDDLELPITLKYLDANNGIYTEIKYVTVPLYTQAEAEQFMLKPKAFNSGYLIFIVVLILGYAGYRYKRDKKA
ncbi:MAG: hypothetical protein K0B02_02230 [DPANN group archaeon]|nr:hypothetical protein [DPANN group archaeon]